MILKPPINSSSDFFSLISLSKCVLIRSGSLLKNLKSFEFKIIDVSEDLSKIELIFLKMSTRKSV
jgi:hypothetical protein